MKATVTFMVSREIDVPEGTLTLDAKRIVQDMTPEELVQGAVMVQTLGTRVDVYLPHANTSFVYAKDELYPYR